MGEFKWWQEGGTKHKDVFEEKVLKIEESFWFGNVWNISCSRKQILILFHLQTFGIRLIEFPLPLPLPLKNK